MNSSNFILKCKNCQKDLYFTLLTDNFFQCVLCKHYASSGYGIWHCANECDMDICPLCSLKSQYLCKLCQNPVTFVNQKFFQNQNIYKCNECLKEFLMEDGTHFCFSCKKFFCCIDCRSKQNDLYNRDSEFYDKGFNFQ